MPSDLAAVFEPTAGYLLVEECVRAHLNAAIKAGAQINTNCDVVDWKADPDQITVHTAAGKIVARTLVIAAGAWSGVVLDDLNVRLSVRRKSLFWFRNERPENTLEGGLPVFLFELPKGIFYGFPQLDPRGVKVGEHTGGEPVTEPSLVNRSQNSIEQQRLARFLAAQLPGVTGEVTDHTVCLYTMTPDEHFILDRHPRHSNVVFAAGLSGHGFKFTPVLGQALADLVLEGQSDLPIGFLSLDRFSLPVPRVDV
jgi:glycine/D-amino acid oxidase-like deaminating enzyme